MGVDAVGLDPKSPIGKEVRNIRGIAALAIAIAPDITCHCEDWHHSFTGDGLSAEDCEALADRLEARLVAEGVPVYAREYLGRGDVEMFIAFLRDCGGFSIW